MHEAANGVDGLEAIIRIDPDVVMLDWEMPDITGGEFMRIVRSPLTFAMLRAPGKFALPDVPVIMLTGHVERETRGRGGPARRQRVSLQAGVGQGDFKSASGRSAASRATMVRIGDYYGPEPRKVAGTIEPLADPGRSVLSRRLARPVAQAGYGNA